MKLIQLSSLAVLFLGMFSSCTKDDSQFLSISKANPFNESGEVGKPKNSQENGNTDVNPTMTIVYNPNPGTVGQTVNVTGSLAPAAGEVAPNCGKLQLQQMQGGEWVAVANADVSASIHEVSYNFIPTTAGTDVYEFRVHFIKGGCSGYSNNFSDSYFLSVMEPCLGLSISGVASAVPAEAGFYEFTVTYTVETCDLEFDKLKTQGGLTNGSELISSEGGISWIPGQSTNKIIKWEEIATAGSLLPTGTRTYVVKFKKAYSGSGPIEITGGWSVSASKIGGDSVKAEFDPITYQ